MSSSVWHKNESKQPKSDNDKYCGWYSFKSYCANSTSNFSWWLSDASGYVYVTLQYIIWAFVRKVVLRNKLVNHARFRKYYIFSLESKRKDFIVEFKGKKIRLKKLLRQHKMPLGKRNAVLAAVLEEKDSTLQSCKGRCFGDERKHSKTCYCDMACKTFRDCCLDFHLRYVWVKISK